MKPETVAELQEIVRSPERVIAQAFAVQDGLIAASLDKDRQGEHLLQADIALDASPHAGLARRGLARPL